MEFSCRNPFTGGDLCFGGGLCAFSNSTSTCACPENTFPDNFYYRIPNCSVSRNTGLVFFILSSVCAISLLIFYVTVVHKQVKIEFFPIRNFTLLFLISTYACIAAVYLQDGCYEGCSVFFSTSFILGSNLVGKVLLKVTEPVFSLSKTEFRERFKKLIFVNFIADSIILCACAITMIIFARDNLKFNIIALVAGEIIYFLVSKDLAMTSLWTIRLEKEIRKTFGSVSNVKVENSTEDATIRFRNSIISRLKWLRRIFSIDIALCLALIVIMPATILTIGSVSQ